MTTGTGQPNARPADHVTVELAEQLREAGLTWEPRVGDWAWVPERATRLPRIGIQVGGFMGLVIGEACGNLSIYGADRRGPWAVLTTDCLWLPTGGQCLAEIARRGQTVNLRGQPQPRAYQWASDLQPDGGMAVYCPELADLVGLLLMDALKAEKAQAKEQMQP